MFIRHRRVRTDSNKKNNALRQTILRLHRDRRTKVRCPLHRCDGKSCPSCWQHKNQLTPGFTSRYNLTSLVYFEHFIYPDAAIDREKEIKGWRRSKKIKLIESMNPHWEDLAKDWGNEYKPEPAAADEREFPRPAGENAGLRDDAPVTELEAD
jgi:predicted GIY-YIG superfamily endonuclease